MKRIENKIKFFIQNFNQYLFSPAPIERLAFFRIFLTLALLWVAIYRQLNMDQYTVASMIPQADALGLYPDFYRPGIQFFFWPDDWAPYVHLIYIVSLVLILFGLNWQYLMLISWALAQGFINRNYSMLFGADLIGNLFLFYLSFTNCCDYLSVKNLISSIKPVKNAFNDKVSAVFFRLMQIQICVIYAYTGFEKLKGNSWWDGTALWTVFANPQFIHYDFPWLRAFPLFFTFGTFITIIFEVYFPVLVAFRKTRYLWLALGVLFHCMIGLLLGLMPFSLVMMSTYFLLLIVSNLDMFVIL